MRPAVLVAVALVLAACGKRSEPSGDKGGSAASSAESGDGVDIRGFCERTMEAANPSQCWGRDAQARGIKISMCVELLRGRLDIDPAKLAACEKAAVAGIATLSNHRGINDLAARFPECRGVTTGRQAAADECLGTMECAPGLVCSGMRCRTPHKEGEECRQILELSMALVESDCADGLYCDLADGSDAKCKPRVAADAACSSSAACADGLRCRGGTCIAAAPSKAGDECDDDPDCPAGHDCTLSHRCEPLLADGASCISDSECEHRCVTTGDSFSGTCGPC